MKSLAGVKSTVPIKLYVVLKSEPKAEYEVFKYLYNDEGELSIWIKNRQGRWMNDDIAQIYIGH